MNRKPPSNGSVTLEDVARVAGVSRATVSRVINGSTTVDPAMRRLVEDAVAATDYVPNRAARSLVTRRTDSIALVVSEAEQRNVADPFLGRMFTDPFFGRMVTGVMEVIRPRGVQLVLMLVDDADSRTHLVSYLRQGHVDGVVLISGHAADPLPGLLADAAVPAVLSGRPGQPTPISFVEADQRAGTVLGVEHLVATGRRRIATLTGPLDMPSAQERLAGFRQAMAAHGLAEAGVVEGDFTQAGGAAAMRLLLEQAPDLDAVFIASDLMALGAVPVLNRAGRRIPEDVALVGFDDSSAALACDPQLTTVRQPLEEMASRMAQLLLQQIAEPEESLQSVVFQPTLVIRGSA
ncbi:MULTISPECIES: LacI family DNA-binding transcriptional regulator [Streptacidiphilus]|uniref:LacI family DNA-binding transcriptional regulator n=1 Tax=Streptacidiphilus cavernicola TaxID=3342716 RepID=A0ABV6UFN0_9ACTN|nr:LacI family DNA-binding transcriptional regulator [Streptacidiphilus jeojiense]